MYIYLRIYTRLVIMNIKYFKNIKGYIRVTSIIVQFVARRVSGNSCPRQFFIAYTFYVDGDLYWSNQDRTMCMCMKWHWCKCCSDNASMCTCFQEGENHVDTCNRHDLSWKYHVSSTFNGNDADMGMTLGSFDQFIVYMWKRGLCLLILDIQIYGPWLRGH